MTSITFAEDAWEEYLYWQVQDKKTLKKINTLLKEVQRTPYEGTGKPEPLKGNLEGKWSRRINDKDRLVYEVMDGTIIVQQCKGHYEDK
ncbi:MAG: Txe/YoeB family addiction module toxin [Peptococcaceae bacterium]|nr:Txe/YoeB family addiction module toxin [Peptococcaceae bacterium]